MEPQEPVEPQQQDTKPTGGSVWLLLVAVFVAAVAVTLFIGSRNGDSTKTTFPDLGDIAENDPNVPAADEAAPRFALEGIGGEVFELNDHITNDGRPVVLNLWASWCAPCRAEMPAIDTSSNRHPEVAFVGVAVQDDLDKATAFANEIAVSYTLVFDDGTVEEAYPVLGLPATFFIDGDGTIVNRHFGIVTIDSLDDDIAEFFGS